MKPDRYQAYLEEADPNTNCMGRRSKLQNLWN